MIEPRPYWVETLVAERMEQVYQKSGRTNSFYTGLKDEFPDRFNDADLQDQKATSGDEMDGPG